MSDTATISSPTPTQTPSVPDLRPPVMWPGVVITILLATLAFSLSFVAQRELAQAMGIGPNVTWMFPIIIDGFIVAASWAAWGLREQSLRVRAYPLLLLVVAVGVSVVGNMAHAHPVSVHDIHLGLTQTRILSAVPPLALLGATHLLVILARPRTIPAAQVSRVDHVTPVEHTPTTSPDFNAHRPTYFHTFETVPTSTRIPEGIQDRGSSIGHQFTQSEVSPGHIDTDEVHENRDENTAPTGTIPSPHRMVVAPGETTTSTPTVSVTQVPSSDNAPKNDEEITVTGVENDTSDMSGVLDEEQVALALWLAPKVISGRSGRQGQAARNQFPTFLTSPRKAQREISALTTGDGPLSTVSGAKQWLADHSHTTDTLKGQLS